MTWPAVVFDASLFIYLFSLYLNVDRLHEQVESDAGGTGAAALRPGRYEPRAVLSALCCHPNVPHPGLHDGSRRHTRKTSP